MSPVSTAALIAGRYRLDYQLASDQVAEVWQATDLELARPVAVKLLHAGAGDAESVRQFRAAACRAASLVHENLVRVFDYCEPEPSDSPQCPFLVMEYVEGDLLPDLPGGRPLEASRTVDVVAQVAAALQVVHQAGLAHGDIRPGKILMSRDGAAKLFGFSGACPTGPAAIAGDLRALGILAREYLTEPTSPGGSGANSEQVPEPVAQFVAELCADGSAGQPDATAAIARRAAALRAQLDPSAPAGSGAAPSTRPPAPLASRGVASHASALTLGRLPGRPTGPAAVTAVPAGHLSAKHRNLVALRTSAVIVIALAAVAIFGALKPNDSAPHADGATKPASIRVTAAKLIGRPVNVVRLRLERLGLVVRLRWRESASVSSGEVVAVRPAGLVPVHSVVVIIGSSGRPAMATGPDVTQSQNTRRHGQPQRPVAHKPVSQPQTPAPSASPSSSPTSSASPTSSPSPSSSPPPSSSRSPSSSPPPDSTTTAD
jgi:serine/threonine-protein kinase